MGPNGSYASVVSTPRHSSAGTLRLVERSDRIDRFVHVSRCRRGELSREVGRSGLPWLPTPGRVFTPINFPLATGTTAFGINDTGEITGYYTDASASGTSPRLTG